MSNNLKLEVLLKAVDQATRPFKSIQTVSQSLSENIRSTQQTLHDLNAQAAQIGGFRQTSSQLALTGQSLRQAKQHTAALALQIKNVQSPTDAQTKALSEARQNTVGLQTQYEKLRLSVQRQRQALGDAGISTRKLSADDRRLKNGIAETTARLGQQREALARVNTQRDKINAVKQRYQAGKELAGRVSAFGSAATRAGAIVGKLKLGGDQRAEHVKTIDGDEAAPTAIGTDLFVQQDSPLSKLAQTATSYVLQLNGWLQSHQGIAASLSLIVSDAPMVMGIIGSIGSIAGQAITAVNLIIAGAGILGTVFGSVSAGIVTAIGAITWPVIAVAAAVVAGALLIRAYWEPISAFFSGVIEGLVSAFAPVGAIFAPLAPVFSALGDKLNGVWQWFKNLIAPIQFTQDALNSCRDAGVMFGQMLADALLLPLNSFNKLRSGIDWVLGKLGIINEESSSLDETAKRADAAMQSRGSLLSSGNTAYQPVAVQSGRSFVDNSKKEYVVNVNAGNGADGAQIAQHIHNEFKQFDYEPLSWTNSDMTIDLN